MAQVMVFYSPRHRLEFDANRLPPGARFAVADLAEVPQSDDEVRAAVDRLLALLVLVEERAPLAQEG